MKLRIHGIKNGKHNIELKEDVKNIPYIFPEFFGEIKIKGILTKLNSRFSFIGNATCNAKLVCDISLEEYIEKITAEISVQFVANTDLFFLQKQKNANYNEELAVHEDDEFFDLTEEISDTLNVSLPMKRLSPNCREKEFGEFFPEYSSNKLKENLSDDR